MAIGDGDDDGGGDGDDDGGDRGDPVSASVSFSTGLLIRGRGTASTSSAEEGRDVSDVLHLPDPLTSDPSSPFDILHSFLNISSFSFS